MRGNLIPENNDFFPKCDTISIGPQTTIKSTRKKGAQYKGATIMNKFTQTVNVITYNTISIKTMPHPCTCLESRKKSNISCQVLREQNEKQWLYLYLGLVFEIYETLKFKKLATSKMSPFWCLTACRSQLLSYYILDLPQFLFTLSGFFSRLPYCSRGEKGNTKGL